MQATPTPVRRSVLGFVADNHHRVSGLVQRLVDRLMLSQHVGVDGYFHSRLPSTNYLDLLA
jgi:hypothetical protein